MTIHIQDPLWLKIEVILTSPANIRTTICATHRTLNKPTLTLTPPSHDFMATSTVNFG